MITVSSVPFRSLRARMLLLHIVRMAAVKQHLNISVWLIVFV